MFLLVFKEAEEEQKNTKQNKKERSYTREG
jgi:hypothetical protein